MTKISLAPLALAATLACAATASLASPIVLNFEGINATYPSGYANIGGYYNGGTSSDGTSGTNYGVEFSDNALAMCMNTPGISCSNTSRGGLAPGSEFGGLFFLSGTETYMNVAAGFDTGFSFYYSAPFFLGSVSVFDGLNGTGTLLATLALTFTPNTGCGAEYGANYCPFVASGLGFVGTAKSVAFAGVADYIVFDDVTFGSVTPGVPEPETYALMLAGLALTSLVARRRRG